MRLPLSMLIAYDVNDVVIATLEVCIAYNDSGEAVGLVDFAAHELAAGELIDIWTVEGAAGSKTWPEWIDPRGWTVERAGPPGKKRIEALVHPNGHRRERAAIEAAIEERIAQANGKPADIRDIVGGPDRPLILDDDGVTVGRTVSGSPKHLSLIAAEQPASDRSEVPVDTAAPPSDALVGNTG